MDTLELGNNNLTAVPESAFAGLSSLKVLNVNSNSLTAIPANVYSNLPKLEQLYLLDNDNPTIDEAAFANLPSLKFLRLQNQVITGGYPTGVFAGLGALEQLYLDNTGISVVDAGWFTDLTSLSLLRLRNNVIQTLPSGVFSTQTNLNELRLENNNIISLDAGIFDGLPLASLNLANNALTQLPKNLFLNHPNPETLTSFDITGNPLTTDDGNLAYNANGWEITDVAWQSDGSAFGYELSIDHALPSNLVINFTVTNGTVTDSATGSVTIISGSTTSTVITVMPIADATSFGLDSSLAPFTTWGGHINATSTTFEVPPAPYCAESDSTLGNATAVQVINDPSIPNPDCEDLTQTILQAEMSDLELNGTSITAIDPAVTRALTGTQILRLNDNNLTAVPAEAFANLAALTELYLHENEISSIGANALWWLGSTERSDFEQQQLGDACC